MVHRGTVPGDRAARSARPRLPLVLALAGLLLTLGVLGVERATGTLPGRCEQFAADGSARSETVTGSGADVLVVGDSWTAGLGLDDPARSWPSRLPGRVHAAGFSGSGFGAGASGCGPRVSFGARAADAVRTVPAGTPVVVAGGLNDWDSSDAEVGAGRGRGLTADRGAPPPPAAPPPRPGGAPPPPRVLTAVSGHPVTVVGPANAPARSAYVARVEGLLERLCAERGVRFVAVSDLRLDYLPDLLHLTPAGHAAFGDAVAERLSTGG